MNTSLSSDRIYEWLSAIPDPEIPVISITDLGIIRDIQPAAPDSVTVTITPTYSGCPAMDAISMNIRMVLLSHGIKNIYIKNQLSPAWTTDWMSEDGKRKLKAYGIAPPARKAGENLSLFQTEQIPCPKCGSENTVETSRYGSTACKALFRCNTCQEPFEHFKCH